jgi:hypothetical protein
MLLGAAISDRLKAGMPALGGRVLRSGEFFRMLETKVFPQVTPVAAVLPIGLRGDAVVATHMAFRQVVLRQVAVVLVHRAPNMTEAAATADLEALVADVLATLLGWTPEETTPGVLQLVSGRLRDLDGGVLTYELVLALEDEILT